MMRASMLILAVALAACQTASQERRAIQLGTPLALSHDQIIAVQVGVMASLKDPDSARFGPIYAVRSPDGVIVACGYVNAKNSFGGYTGDQPFNGVLTSSGRFMAAAVGGDDMRISAILTVCQRSGIML
jgi:hypothetical protein